eukprot:COSAG01_NODE_25828_length_731_cov_25.007911_1_plen_60_part_10
MYTAEICCFGYSLIGLVLADTQMHHLALRIISGGPFRRPREPRRRIRSRFRAERSSTPSS